MIINCNLTSKIAALIPQREKVEIKNYLKNAVEKFCAEYYDQIYYDRWFSLNDVFPDGDFYRHKPLVAVYDYYLKVGKTEKDAAIFALMDLNSLLEEILSESSGVYKKNTESETFYLSSFMLIDFGK